MEQEKQTGVVVELLGRDGNAFAVLGACVKAARRAKVDEATIKEFQEEAMSGDYDHLLQTVMRYFVVE